MDKVQLIKDKLVSIEELSRMIKRWQLKDDVVVFTNGCFDILHQGHMELIAKAANEGDRLIVALNSDESVTKLKGSNRPINTIDARVFSIASLHFVDAVIIFDEETPAALIEATLPDVLVKGGDYSKDQIVGADTVEKNGGKVSIIELTEGFSSSAMIEKIKAS